MLQLVYVGSPSYDARQLAGACAHNVLSAAQMVRYSFRSLSCLSLLFAFNVFFALCVMRPADVCGGCEAPAVHEARNGSDRHTAEHQRRLCLAKGRRFSAVLFSLISAFSCLDPALECLILIVSPYVCELTFTFGVLCVCFSFRVQQLVFRAHSAQAACPRNGTQRVSTLCGSPPSEQVVTLVFTFVWLVAVMCCSLLYCCSFCSEQHRY